MAAEHANYGNGSVGLCTNATLSNLTDRVQRFTDTHQCMRADLTSDPIRE